MPLDYIVIFVSYDLQLGFPLFHMRLQLGFYYLHMSCNWKKIPKPLVCFVIRASEKSHHRLQLRKMT
jgi:hypothetical protein